MKKAAAKAQPLLILRTLHAPTPSSKPPSLLFSTSNVHHQSPPQSQSLTADQITQINLLIPRLCQRSDHIPHALRLIDTVLLLRNPPPLNSLSLPILIYSLTSSSGTALSMSFLTRLARNAHAGPHRLPVARLLLSSYFKLGKPREALAVLRWMFRTENCLVDGSTYRMAVVGLCGNGKTVEALKVVKRMVGEGIVVEEEARAAVYRSLLREARVRDALELDGQLRSVGEGGGGGGGGDRKEATVELIDQMVRSWQE